jgi:hypothetical protein
MSPEQARSTILKQHPAAKDIKVTAEASTNYYSQSMGAIGELFVIEPYVINSPTDNFRGYGEAIEIIYAPNASDLIGIVRTKGYRIKSFPTYDSVVAALLQKYGKPTHSDMQNPPSYFMPGATVAYHLNWTARANLQFVGGTESYGPSEPSRRCAVSGGIGTGGTILYEAGDEDIANASNKFGDVASSSFRGSVSANFIGVLNTIKNNNDRAYSTCGAVFLTYIQNAEKHDYVSNIGEKILDLERANAELAPVVDAFNKKAEEAKQQKLKKDSSKAPTF